MFSRVLKRPRNVNPLSRKRPTKVAEVDFGSSGRKYDNVGKRRMITEISDLGIAFFQV